MSFNPTHRHSQGFGRCRLELDPTSRHLLVKTGWFSAPRIIAFDDVRTVEVSTSNAMVKPYVLINTKDLDRPQHRVYFHTGSGAQEWYNRLGAAMNMQAYR
ncbi:TPA: hypothetical protein QDA96_001472 [Burkholderia vietnamiensis]|uniref:hypothetical protein n=1 Tax=Burkholderia vietnamiensis TaxID=60552 RepID=UPI00075F2D53|nr:hypothetical protein [Burkholderia vietnamiensis]KVS26784.1 hypothetical protein WK34_13475 [Burkholderia vietnamiensis]MBR8014087.1 hypothetical protein [Burkholderia vietnamiensis]HDR9040826.1 hypothetical protein [Burkholderia vietnamiensis]HDR9168707.1 hypothetical protein [Burkholderia vietnamiensis]HDR9195826.1 hypothetical protein [Burkholderia vietnamiensis]